MPSSEDRPRIICRCLGVASPRLFAAIRAGNLTSVAEVTKVARAGGGCGTCHPEIEEILADVAGLPVPGAVRLENRLVNEAETLSRVEGSIESRIRPALAARGVRLTEFRLTGLHVYVRLEGAGDGDALAFVRDELRRLVCRDLEIALEPDAA